MEFSKRVQDLSINSRYLSNNPLNYLVHTHLNQLDIDVYIHFETFSGDEVLIAKAYYYTDYKGPYLGVIDGFFSLIQGKPVEAADRFPIKELDYFLRDESTRPAFTAYSQEIYEIISLGEKIKTKIFGKKNIGFSYDIERDGEFTELSTSEQFELIEELLADEFFKLGVDPEDIELIDVDENTLVFSAKDDLKLEIETKILKHIDNLIIKFS